MSIKMSTKRSKKSNLENASSSGNKKNVRNVINPELENVTNNKKPKKKEYVNIGQDENKTEVKVGRKRKITNVDRETSVPKKVRKKNNEQIDLNNVDIENVLSVPSSTNNFNNKDVDTSSNSLRQIKKKLKTSDSDITSDQNDSSISIGEMPLQQNGKRKDREKSIQEADVPNKETSLHNVDDMATCKQEGNYNNVVNDDIKDEPLRTDDVINITGKDLEGTDSDLNESSTVTEIEKKIDKVDISKGMKNKELINWPKEDLKKLVDRMEACVPEHDVLAFSTRVEKLEWDTVMFKNYTVEDCKKTWSLLQKQIRRFRLLKEVLADAREWINSPKTRSKRPASRHPDMPRKPLTAYFIYYLKKKDLFHKTHPGLDATEISKILGQEFKNLSPEKKLKYEKLAANKKEEYEQKVDEFYKTHPEVPRIAKVQRIRTEKLPKPQKLPKPSKRLKLVKPIKEKPLPKQPKERIPKRPPPPFQYYYLSEVEKQKQNGQIADKLAFKEVCKEKWKELCDAKKLVWINYAESEYAKYEEALKQYIESHPDYVHTHKPLLSKEEIQIKDRVAGKPIKPPGSAYNLFARMLLQSNEIKGIPVKDRLIFVSNQWKNCVDEEKKQYKELSTKLNEKYKSELASYLETLPEEERKRELQKFTRRRRKSETTEKKQKKERKQRTSKKTGVGRKRKVERKPVVEKLVEPEQPPISAFKYFTTLYTGEEPVAKAWKALAPEQKKTYEDELVKKKQAYILDFEKYLKSLTKEELEAFSNSRRRTKKDEEVEEEEEEEESSEESETDDSEAESNEQDEKDEETK